MTQITDAEERRQAIVKILTVAKKPLSITRIRALYIAVRTRVTVDYQSAHVKLWSESARQLVKKGVLQQQWGRPKRLSPSHRKFTLLYSIA